MLGSGSGLGLGLMRVVDAPLRGRGEQQRVQREVRRELHLLPEGRLRALAHLGGGEAGREAGCVGGVRLGVAAVELRLRLWLWLRLQLRLLLRLRL